MGSAANSSSLLNGNRALSMLDSKFGSAETILDKTVAAYNNEEKRGHSTSVDLLQPMKTTNVYTSSKSSIWEDGVS